MIIRRTLLASIIVGLLAGLALSFFQITSINPVLFEAETFEVAEADDHASHTHDDGHSHDHEAWAPEDGAERTFFMFLSNVFAGIGFAAVLLAVMSQLQLTGFINRANAIKGIGWGVAGFLVFFVAPGIGLPPEIPGIQAAALEHRQLWWTLTVLCAGAGLLTLVLASMKYKLFGLLLIAVPYLVGAPHHEGPLFSHPDANAVQSLEQLHQQFILMSGIGNFIFWLVIGVCSAIALSRYVLQGVNNTGDQGAAVQG